jgi:hypothetical protein
MSFYAFPFKEMKMQNKIPKEMVASTFTESTTTRNSSVILTSSGFFVKFLRPILHPIVGNRICIMSLDVSPSFFIAIFHFFSLVIFLQ